MLERQFHEDIELFLEDLATLEESKIIDAVKARAQKLIGKYREVKQAALEPLVKKGLDKLSNLAAKTMPVEWEECKKLGFSGNTSCRKRAMNLFSSKLQNPKNLVVAVSIISLLISLFTGEYFGVIDQVFQALEAQETLVAAYETISGIQDIAKLIGQAKQIQL